MLAHIQIRGDIALALEKHQEKDRLCAVLTQPPAAGELHVL